MSAWRLLTWFSLGVAPGIAAVAWSQFVMYGSPLRSGYGSLDVLFSLSHVAANLRRYPAWLLSTHGPVVLLAVLAPVMAARRREALVLGAFVLATFAMYVPYTNFDDWWYLRFLLPAMPALIVLASIPVARSVERLGPAWRAPVLAALVAVVAAFWIHTARERLVFDLYSLEQKYPVTGDYVRTHLPPNAMVVAGNQSGSVRYYAARPTLAWDLLDPRAMDGAIAFLRRAGYEPYFVLETWEEPRFRDRFAGQNALGALDWPPMAQVGAAVRIFDAADRDRYLAGESVRTDRVWLGRRPGR